MPRHGTRAAAGLSAAPPCCASFLETASEGAPTPRETRGAGLALEAAAGTSHHKHAPKERGLPPAQCHSRGNGRPQPALEGARSNKLECRASFLQTVSIDAPAPRATRDAGLALEIAAGASHHGRAPKERGLSPAQCHSKENQHTTASAGRRTRSNKLECRASFLQAVSVGAPAPRKTFDAGLALEIPAGTSHHGRAPTQKRPLAATVFF